MLAVVRDPPQGLNHPRVVRLAYPLQGVDLALRQDLNHLNRPAHVHHLQQSLFHQAPTPMHEADHHNHQSLVSPFRSALDHPLSDTLQRTASMRTLLDLIVLVSHDLVQPTVYLLRPHHLNHVQKFPASSRGFPTDKMKDGQGILQAGIPTSSRCEAEVCQTLRCQLSRTPSTARHQECSILMATQTPTAMTVLCTDTQNLTVLIRLTLLFSSKDQLTSGWFKSP